VDRLLLCAFARAAAADPGHHQKRPQGRRHHRNPAQEGQHRLPPVVLSHT
jgi:hypothetical protein